MENQNQNEIEIDLLDLFYYLKKRIWIIAVAFVACAFVGLIFSSLFMTPKYTASTRMYVLNRSSENNVNSGDFAVSNYLLNDYKVLITGQNVTKEVIDRLGLDMKHEELAELIEVTAPNDTRVLQVDITHPDPQVAADIANAVREVSSAQIKEIMDVEAVQLVYEAEVPENPSSPNVMKNTVIAAALGLIGAAGILVVIRIMDDTIRTEEDVDRWLGLSVLGIIPISAELNAMSGVQNNKKKGLLNDVMKRPGSNGAARKK